MPGIEFLLEARDGDMSAIAEICRCSLLACIVTGILVIFNCFGISLINTIVFIVSYLILFMCSEDVLGEMAELLCEPDYGITVTLLLAITNIVLNIYGKNLHSKEIFNLQNLQVVPQVAPQVAPQVVPQVAPQVAPQVVPQESVYEQMKKVKFPIMRINKIYQKKDSDTHAINSKHSLNFKVSADKTSVYAVFSKETEAESYGPLNILDKNTLEFWYDDTFITFTWEKTVESESILNIITMGSDVSDLVKEFVRQSLS